MRLIQRSTRRFSVTEIGQEYYRHCVAMLVEADAAQEAIERSRSEPQGIVRVSCPPALLCFQVGDMIARFMAANPRVEVHLESTSRRVDVMAEGFDLAIRVRVPAARRKRSGDEGAGGEHAAVGGEPEAARWFGVSVGARRPRHPAESSTSGLPIVSISGVSKVLTARRPWSPIEPRLVTDDMIQMRLAALRGVGVVQLPTMMVDEDLADGTAHRCASQLGSPQRHCARRLSLTARTAAVCAQLHRLSDGRIQRVDRGSAGSHRELIVRPRDVAFWPLSDFTRCPT